LTIDLRGINQKNFENKINKLQEKILWLLDNNINYQMTSQSSIDEALTGLFIFKKNIFFFIKIENSCRSIDILR
jgi:hypothetical protein